MTLSAQTHGWDTVFAMHIAEVNAAIRDADSTPPGFRQANPEGYAVEGRFGTWSIVPGGSGDLLCMAIPFHDTVATSPTSRDTVSGTLKVHLRLDLLHDADVNNRRHLKVRTTAIGPDVPVVSGAEVKLENSNAGSLTAIVVKTLLEDWLNANLGDFEHVFATIDVERRAASGAFQWMQPTEVAYAYTDLGSVTDGALAILAMTGGRPATGLVQQVSSGCIPEGQRASLLISKERVMAQLLLPGMPRAFQGATSKDFTLSQSGDSIVNAKPVAFTVSHEGKDYPATVTTLAVTLEGEELAFDVTTEVWLMPGVHARTRTISTLSMCLTQAKDGGQTLAFRNVRDPVNQHEVVKSTGAVIVEDVLLLAAAIAGLVVTILSAGTLIWVGLIVVALAFGAEKVYEKYEEDSAPSIGAAVLDATAAISWPSGSRFQLVAAQLNDSLQLTGHYLES